MLHLRELGEHLGKVAGVLRDIGANGTELVPAEEIRTIVNHSYDSVKKGKDQKKWNMMMKKKKRRILVR